MAGLGLGDSIWRFTLTRRIAFLKVLLGIPFGDSVHLSRRLEGAFEMF